MAAVTASEAALRGQTTVPPSSARRSIGATFHTIAASTAAFARTNGTLVIHQAPVPAGTEGSAPSA